MFSLMWRQLRGRAGRSVALVLGVLVAATGFVVLTGAAGTAVAGTLLSGLAALVPTALLRRLPIARLLAEE